ncbi:MAG TPA: helix-hairpin-helix domain-containing protein [Bryobacteraceae bacterium]|nr:helix-hairpin-helix domain-containing protein [Bryobacteraceae bacterium]
MRMVKLVCAAIVLSGVVFAQGFPDLPGKDTTLRACGTCHEPERAASLHQDKAGWDATMSAMVGRGMQLSDADYTTVLDYLSKAFPAQALPPININTAESIDLESGLSLLRSQAAAIVAYRDKHGKFKSLDDLKKVPGVDFAKIEAHKDRISFQ